MSIQGIQDTSSRSTPLRVDAQRNLEHVLRAAREVFGELGYGAPMEDVARRARVGVGTVYRRFPSKEVLVRRIAEEETARLTEQAQTALGQEEEPWSALSSFLRTSAASGAGRLLPPRILRAGAMGGADHDERGPRAGGAAGAAPAWLPAQPDRAAGAVRTGRAGQPDLRLVEPSAQGTGRGTGRKGSGPGAYEGLEDDPVAAELLNVVGRLVERARVAGALRGDVTVGDVLLVIATAAPTLPDPAQQATASARLLDILLQGLRTRG
jgi:AcrR family transcriptional regulator